MTVALVSKAMLVKFVNLRDDDDRYDSVLNNFAVMASELIEDYLGRSLEQLVRTEFKESYASYPGDTMAQLLWLDAYPVDTSLEPTVKYSNSLDHDGPAGRTLLNGKDFLVDPTKGIVRVFDVSLATALPLSGGSSFQSHPVGFKVIYKAGFPPITGTGWTYLDVPMGLATATAMQAAFYFHAHTRGSLGLDTAGGDSSNASKSKPGKTSEGENLIPEVRTALRPYLRKGSQLGRAR